MEIWKTIEGYEGMYQVSNLGNVKSLERNVKHFRGGDKILKERILNPTMKANELRIGNYISIPQYGSINNITERVTSDIIASLYNNGLHSDRYEPIPLTEEWLFKFGFEQPTREFDPFDKGKLSIHLKDETFVNGRIYFNSWFIVDMNLLKHVHQIQNLYFALTGEELTTNN